MILFSKQVTNKRDDTFLHISNTCPPPRKRRLRWQSSFSVIFAFKRDILLRSDIWLCQVMLPFGQFGIITGLQIISKKNKIRLVFLLKINRIFVLS